MGIMCLSRTKSKKFSVLTITCLLLICFFAVAFNPYFAKGGGVWWDSNWQYRKNIMIDHTKVSANLTNFPILINITDSSLSSHAQSSGNDIAFADYSGNKLNHEIELFNSPTGYLVAWVKVPSLSSTADTILYMYYGNPSASNQQNVAGTWDSNYVMVQHLGQATGSFIDSTGNHNDCAPNGGVSHNVTGEIDGAAGFDGSSSYATIPFGLSPPYTIECWANPVTLTQDNAIVSFQQTDSGGSGVSMGIYNTKNALAVGNYAYQYALSGVSTHLTAGTWAYWCDAVTAANNIAFYLNGAAQTLSSSPNSYYSNDANYRVIGARHSTSYSRFWNGAVDEVRISNIVRSASWLSTEYNNQQSPSSFYTVGSEEAFATLTISNPSPLNGATRVSTSLSVLSFDLTDYLNDSMNYYVTTSPNIGSGQGLGVYNGAYSVGVSGLQLNTTYTWQVCAIDPLFGIWNNQTFSFKTIEFYGNWWNIDWPYRKAIIIDHAKVTGSLANFTVLIDTTDLDLANKAQVSGNDIVFADTYGNKLNHEIEFYDNGAGRLVAWVNVPTLSSVSDTVLYMYYGNPSASNQQNSAGTWDSNYLMVQHLEQATGTFIDSTGYHYNCTPYGGVSQNVSGKIDGAAGFDGSSSYATIPFVLSPPYTIECWANPTTLNQSSPIVSFGQTDSGGSGVGMGIFATDNEILIGNSLYHYGLTGVSTYLTAGTWAYWCDAVTAANNIAFYLNGAAQTLSSSVPSWFSSDDPNHGVIGARYLSGYSRFWNGAVDEVRISNIVRSASWLSTEYNNQQSPSSFYTVASEETFSLKFPSISNLSPAIGATVGPSLSVLSFDLTDYLNDSMNYYVTTSPNIGSGQGLGVYNGAYSVGVSGLQLNTTYTWQVCAIDPLFGIWNNQTFSFKTMSDLEVTSASPAALVTLDRGSQQTFQVSYIIPADITWYMNGLQQQVDYNLQTASWNCTFSNLGVFNVTASASALGLTGKHEWSVEVVINFTGGVADRVRTDFVATQPWEKGWVYDECIWFDHDFGTYFMLYNGAPIGQRRAGFAWSTNGLNWTKYAGNPVLSPLPSTWESSEVCWTTTHIKINGTYWVYYQSGSVGLAFLDIAPDGSGGYTVGNVTRYSGNPIVSGANEFSCARVNSTFWIGYIGPTTVSCLSSPDGLTWTYMQKNILVPQGSGWYSSLLTPLYTYIYGGSMYLTLTGNYKEDGVAYCRVGDWTNLTFSPYNPILPIGTAGTWEGGEAGGLTFKVDDNGNVIVNSDNTLDCWYVGVESLGGTGDSGFGHGRIYNINGGPPYQPQLQMSQNTITCRKYGEHFTVQVNVTNAITVDGLNFTIYYSPTLMSYVSVSWGELGSGTITNVDPVNGILEGYVTGIPMSGNRWLLNITFQDIATMIWKQGQVNELDGQIWFHSASLSFSGVGVQPLVYQEGGLGQISVNNVAFKFMPIQGDLTNDGIVDITDLRTVAAYFDVKQGDPLWSAASAYDLNGNGVIDIYDLVLIGANFS